MKHFVQMLFSVAAAAAVVLCSSPVFAQGEEVAGETGIIIGQSGIVIVIVLILAVMVFGNVFYKKKKPSSDGTPVIKRDDEK
jgi:hypothetical protein